MSLHFIIFAIGMLCLHFLSGFPWDGVALIVGVGFVIDFVFKMARPPPPN
jgi:hypothetical protein